MTTKKKLQLVSTAIPAYVPLTDEENEELSVLMARRDDILEALAGDQADHAWHIADPDAFHRREALLERWAETNP